MPEPINLTDAELENVLNGKKPALILFSNGDGLRSDFTVAFKKAAEEHSQVMFARLDPSHNPVAAARFETGDKPVMIGWHNGAEVLRRSKPWGTDVTLAVELLRANIQEPASIVTNGDHQVDNNNIQPVESKPVAVTDATFEQEVLNHDKPVLVDFWAEWCGPCRMVAPTLEKLAAEFAGQVRIAKVNVDENPGLSQAFKVMSIPTIMLIKQRTIVFSQPGALPEPAFRDLIQQLIALELPAQSEPASEN